MKFTYNPRIIRHLGYELITSDEIALTELIKNSYDARATKVNLQLLSSFEHLDEKILGEPLPEELRNILSKYDSKGILLVEDNGTGMNKDVLRKGFFEVGSTLKKEEKTKNNYSEENDSIILGDKGIGRLAAQRIAPTLIVETIEEETSEINIVEINWDEFISNKDYDAPELTSNCVKSSGYTRLWMIGNETQPVQLEKFYEKRQNFEPEDLFGNKGKPLGETLYVKDEMQTALSFLYSPFEKTKSLVSLNIVFDGQAVKLDFDYQALRVAESIHSFSTQLVLNDEGEAVDILFSLKMQIRPWFIERIHHRELGSVLYQDWKRSSSDYLNVLKKYREHYDKNLTDSFLLSTALKAWKKSKKSTIPVDEFVKALIKIAPIEGQIFSFKRDNTLMAMAKRSALENHYIDPSGGTGYDIRPFLGANNGIKLYRNSFRVASIGNKDNDWLELQQKRTTGQQFYRLELGNVIGYVKINDKRQQYIFETSSREHLTENIYANALKITLERVLDIFSPGFTKTAVELTKDFLDLEGWIPENNDKNINAELAKSKATLAAAKKNIETIKGAISSIRENIDLDTPEKINKVKQVFQELEPATLGFEENIEDTNRSFKSANMILEVSKQEQVRIKTEAYNNYKLMANGLVTEIITHELHSLLSNSDQESEIYEQHFETIENHFLNREEYLINRDHLLPIKNKFTHLYKRMGDLDKFYSFLEKTFITNEGNRALRPTEVKDELKIIAERFKFRLSRHKINIESSSVDNVWEVPTGALLHVFYNLIDNSIYWIKERQRQARKNTSYLREELDEITIKSISPSTLQYHDSGTGVLEKYQHTLFNEMVSGRDGGRGMGLYIVRQFLKSFGGEIELLPNLNEFGNRYIFEISMNNYISEDEQTN